MWLSLFCLALITGIAFFQSIHGLFSSLVFCVWTMVCTAIAFATYQYVAFEFLMDLLASKSDFASPIALVLCFAIPLIGGRLALDHFIKRAGLLAAMVDRIGGLFFGVITAFLLVGVLATAIQMLPFGGSVLGFSRFDPNGPGADKEHEHAIWLSPDRFAVGVASMLSSGVFSYGDGKRSLRADHPDLLTEIGWSQTAVAADSRHLAKPGAISKPSVAISDYVYTKVLAGRDTELEYEGAYPKDGHEFWLVAFVPGRDAKDPDDEHRFTLPQIRMVGQRDQRLEQYIPVAVRDSEDVDQVHITDIRDGAKTQSVLFRLWEPGPDGEIKVTFEVPEGFQPQYLVYKTGAWARMRAPRPDEVHRLETDEDDEEAEGEEVEAAADEAPPAAGRLAGRPSQRSRRGGRSEPAEGGPERGGDRVSGARPMKAKSFFGDELPLSLTRYTKASTEGADVAAGALKTGHVIASLGEQAQAGNQPAVSRFEVPRDKRLLQLNVQHLQAGSTYGRALSFAVRTIRNYLVTDNLGEKYELIGQYAIANVDGQQVIEIQYFPQQIGSMGRGVGKFQRIKERHLKRTDTILVYLFLIAPGRQVIEFSTGRGGTDLRNERLVAE